MDVLRPDDLWELLAADGTVHISIYQPSHRAGPDTRQDPIRFKNLLRDAQRRAQAAGLRDVEARDMLKPASDLLEDHEYWQHQGEGLAVFCAPGRFAAFRLPLAFDELVHVNRRFHIKPLLPLFAADRRFYVLAVSQKETRVLSGSRQGIRALDVRSLPDGLRDVLKYFEPMERHVLRSVRAAPRGDRGGTAVFHGHGTPDDDEQDRLREYLRSVDKGMHQLLREERAPLVLAAVDELTALYREVNTYPHLLEEAIHGNADRVRPDELHEKAWRIVETTYLRERAQAAEAVQEAMGTGRGTADLDEVLQLSEQGRLATLFVASDEQRWGRFDPADGVALHDEPEEDDEDLLDRAAGQTLRMGGKVYPVSRAEVPGGGVVAAAARG